MRLLLFLFLFLSGVGNLFGHFPILMPENPSPKKGDEVRIVYRFGHPFEHEITDALKPDRVRVIFPDGKIKDMGQLIKPFLDGGGKKGFTFQLKIEERGDYSVFLESPLYPFEVEGEWVQDIVKVVIHGQAQKNWDGSIPDLLQVDPLTRPYGIFPGMAVTFGLKVPKDIPAPAKGWFFEWEKYNPAPPKELPSPEWITFTGRSDNRGQITVTPKEAGWWVLSTTSGPVEQIVEGKKCQVRKRTSFWFHVAHGSK